MVTTLAKRHVTTVNTGRASTPASAALSMRIRDVINEQSVNQSELARVAGCTRGQVSHWSSGRARAIDYVHASNICRHFGYELDWLILGRGPKRSSITPEARHMLETYGNLPPDKRAKFTVLLSLMVDGPDDSQVESRRKDARNK